MAGDAVVKYWENKRTKPKTKIEYYDEDYYDDYDDYDDEYEEDDDYDEDN